MTSETFGAAVVRAICLCLSVIGCATALAQTDETQALPAAQPADQSSAPPPQPTAPSAMPAAVTKTPGGPLRVVDRIVAVVNDEIITNNELQLRMRIAEAQLRRQNIALPARGTLMHQVLERMIVDRAQLQMAKETGVRVDDATVNAAIARIAEQNGMSLPQFR